MIKFSIITPTLQRPSLVATCNSINFQSHAKWEHIVIADEEVLNEELAEQVIHPQRLFFPREFERGSGHSANKVRHEAWQYTDGDYLLYLDDDNRMMGYDSLERVAAELEANGRPQVAFFPIYRLGGIFMPQGKPGCCHVDTSNLVVAREIGQWPDIPEYTSDGIFIEALVEKYPYRLFPSVPPIVEMPTISGGK